MAEKKRPAKRAARVEVPLDLRGVPKRLHAFAKRLTAGNTDARLKSFRAGYAKAERDGWASWIKSQQDVWAVADGCYFDEENAKTMIDFAPLCRQSKGKWAGQPIELMDWHRNDWVMPLWGWTRADKTRRFRRSYVSMGKKNTKSTSAAWQGLGMLVADCEGGPECYVAATKEEQANITLVEALRMVKKSPDLQELLTTHAHINTIAYPSRDGIFKSLAYDPAGHEGLNIHFVVMDELHVWKNRTFWGSLIYGGIARNQPLQMSITTAGVDLYGIGYEEYMLAKQVLRGDIENTSYFALIYECDPDDDPRDMAALRKANPALGHVLQVSDLEQMVSEAMAVPAKMAEYKRYRMNIWQQGANPWLPPETWARAMDLSVGLDDLARN